MPNVFTCATCGKEFSTYKREQTYCSHNCYYEKLRVDHHRQTEYGRKRIRDYFGNRCTICGWAEATCDIAHIDAGKGDRMDNLILLCPNHHRMFDYYLISKEEMLTIRKLFSNEKGGVELNVGNSGS